MFYAVDDRRSVRDALEELGVDRAMTAEEQGRADGLQLTKELVCTVDVSMRGNPLVSFKWAGGEWVRFRR